MSVRKDDGAPLKSGREEVLDPDLPICDPHIHLWDGPRERGRYLLDDYLKDADTGHNIVNTVYVECGAMYRTTGPEEMRPVGETEFAIDVARRSDSGKYGRIRVADGIVAFADLTLGSRVASVLEKHIEVGGDRLKGIRQPCTWDIDPAVISMAKAKDMMFDSGFRRGFECLKDYGLSFDAWQYYTQLQELADLAQAFPQTRIVVNHAGGPLGVGRHARHREEALCAWKRGMTALAPLSNVFVKLGGLGMPRCGFGWHEQPTPPDPMGLAAAMGPYYETCIELFGVDRCMFESNFPVDRVSYPYSVLWNAFKLFAKDFSTDERKALFLETATGVYRLGKVEACP